MRIYSERPQYTDSNRSTLAAHADDFFAVPLMAKPAEARLIPREEAPARPDLGHSTIISAGLPETTGVQKKSSGRKD